MPQRDLANVLAGPCQIVLGGVDLGHTEGETRLTVTPLVREQLVDSHGRGAVDLIHLGTDVRLEARLAEWTLATLEAIFPLGLAGTGLGLGRPAGARLGALAQAMTLHPLEREAADTSHDLTFWKAVAAGASTVSFGNETDRVFAVTFRLLPDLSRDAGEQIGRIGAA
jgi:hypothetical protein